jgi:hypothetical protein
MESESAATELGVEVMVTCLCSATAKVKLLVVKKEADDGRYRLEPLPKRWSAAGDPRDSFPELFAPDERLEENWTVSKPDKSSRLYVSRKTRFLNSMSIVRCGNDIPAPHESFDTPGMRLVILSTCFLLYTIWDSVLLAVAVPFGTVLFAKAYQRFSVTYESSKVGDGNEWVWEDLDGILNDAEGTQCSPELVAMAQEHKAELIAPCAHLFNAQF